MRIFDKFRKKNKPVECTNARDVLLQQTGLRIVCPDDDNSESAYIAGNEKSYKNPATKN